MTWVIDAILAAVLVGLVWLGAKRGLMKSLAGVISVGAAFFGASWCANRFVTPVSRWLEPLLRDLPRADGAYDFGKESWAHPRKAESCCRPSPSMPTVWRKFWRMWRSG